MSLFKLSSLFSTMIVVMCLYVVFVTFHFFPFPFVLLCSIQLIVTKPTSSLVAHPCCLLSLVLTFLSFSSSSFYSHSTRCSFPLHIVTWIHIIGLSVGELSSRSVTVVQINFILYPFGNNWII